MSEGTRDTAQEREADREARNAPETDAGVLERNVSLRSSPLAAAAGGPPSSPRATIARRALALQRTHGNAYVQRLLRRTPSSSQELQRQAGGGMSVSLNVPLVAQPTPVTCWAASMAMVTGWRDNQSHAPATIASEAGMDTTTGYGWSDIQRAVSAWGLRERGPQSAMPDVWRDLLTDFGPLWIVEVGAPYHAVVVTGISGDGTPDGTTVHLNNPWPPNAGRTETKTFTQFDNDFGLGAGAGAAVVHA